jgi:hypothetical protein
MIIIAAAVLGAGLGVWNARRRDGTALDMLQYGAVTAIAFSLLGLIITVIVHRQLV